MRIVGSIVIRNEADRYLEPCLDYMTSFLDAVFVWDDQSTDQSVEIAVGYPNTQVVVRPDEVPSFLEHEGQFRYAAWKAMEQDLVKPDDWVMSFDADEFLVVDTGKPRAALERAVKHAESRAAVGVVLPVPEVFSYEMGMAQVRVDGQWAQVRGPRLFKYLPEGDWNNKPMGCGSEPTYVAKGPLSSNNEGLHLLHFGYAIWEDRAAKYDRYSSLANHGHANAHIESIITSPQLRKWEGQLPWTLL